MLKEILSIPTICRSTFKESDSSIFFKGEVRGVLLVLKLWMSSFSSENSSITGKINILYNVQWYFMCIYLHAYSMIMCICVYACVYRWYMYTYNTQTKNLWINGCFILWRVLKCANIFLLAHQTEPETFLVFPEKTEMYSPMQPVDGWLSECPLYEFL